MAWSILILFLLISFFSRNNVISSADEVIPGISILLLEETNKDHCDRNDEFPNNPYCGENAPTLTNDLTNSTQQQATFSIIVLHWIIIT